MLRSGRLYQHHMCNNCVYERFEEMFVSHVIGSRHFQKRILKLLLNSKTLVFEPILWSGSSITIWNDFKYSRITVFINSTRFINNLCMLEIWMLCRKVVWSSYIVSIEGSVSRKKGTIAPSSRSHNRIHSHYWRFRHFFQDILLFTQEL